ncbi:MAG: GTPase Era [Cyanobacteria bacterium SIG30]|nr:GTPase Era [Cyanobacteria bacterium SIG30]
MENEFKTGFVTIIARPNVGKSTMLNKIVGQKIAITTNTAQTTRTKIKGILTSEKSQIIFIDTPGVHRPLNKLGEFLSSQTQSAVKDTDLILYLTDVTSPCMRGDMWIYENYLKDANAPVILVFNKIDLVKNQEKLEANIYSYKKMFEKNIQTVRISAKTGKNFDSLIQCIEKYLPEGEMLYPDDEITDQNMRMIASETIREKIILNTRDEVPHSVAVLIDSYKSEEDIDRISATIYVSTDSQKGIIIGKNGSALKKIGMEARIELEKIAEKKIFLQLFVKVQKNWQKDSRAMKMLGLEDER